MSPNIIAVDNETGEEVPLFVHENGRVTLAEDDCTFVYSVSGCTIYPASNFENCKKMLAAEKDKIMDKRKLIDKAVEDLSGKLPKSSGAYAGKTPLVLVSRKYNSYHDGCSGYDTSEFTELCTQEYFAIRAIELGWINGYKWGVEYPTNGKKPDLTDGIQVQRKSRYVLDPAVWNGHVIIDKETSWDDTTAFRIVDERYKPKQPESQTKPDNSWHERGENPPSGTDCDYTIGARPRKSCTFVGINSRGSIVIEDCNGEYRSYHNHQIKLHPIKTEREKFVDAATNAVKAKYAAPETVYENFALALYDAGFKAPDEKSHS